MKFLKKTAAIIMAVTMITGMMTGITFAQEIKDEPYVEGQTITAMTEGESVSSPGAMNNAGLYEDYAKEQLSLRSASARQHSRGSRLTGNNSTVYNILKDYISEVAAGERESTIFEVTLEQLGLNGVYFSASQLGVDAIVENNSITGEAVKALSDHQNVDLNSIVSALLADCPYELYWYDKPAGVSSGQQGITATYDGNEWLIGFTSGITYYFSVASDYSAGSYTVNTALGDRVRHAAQKARDIVDQYKDASDRARLDGYRIAICALTEYNNEAANDPATPYGDPWQIISVFDEDDDTNVVCEGYSKSFQYLCDLSEFEGDISCITVTGNMSGGTGAGSHMWNIVNLEDGNNYLVDVTNCDEGSIGYADQLFLVRRTSDDAEGTLEGGYTFYANGEGILYVYDKNTLSDYDAEELTITITGEHTHTVQIIPAAAATCTQTGLTEGSRCEECGEVITAQEVIPALGHDWDEGVITKEAACTEAGVKTFTCSRCDETRAEELPATGHIWNAPTWTWSSNETFTSASAVFTCQNDASHIVTVEDTALDIATVDPTPTVAGSITYTAEVTSPDGETYTDKKIVTLPVAGYTYMEPVYNWTKMDDGYTVNALKKCNEDAAQDITEEAVAGFTVVTAATCTADGEGLYTAIFSNSAFETQTKVVSIAAMGHTPAEAVRENEAAATCTVQGSYDEVIYCSVCHEELSREIKSIDKIAHTTETVSAVAPTCTEKGLTEGSYCSVCNEVIKAQEEIAALGHDWDEGVITKEAACTEAGVKTFTCTRCKETRTEAVPALGHDFKDGVCTRCDEKDSSYVTPVADGFADNESGRWRIENGEVNFNYNDIVLDNGQWRYYVGGLFQSSYTGVTDFGNNNGWWYVKNGVVDFTANTVAANKNGWWKVTGGRVDFNYKGLASNSNGWWYLEKGKVNFSANTVAANDFGWWKVTNGKVDFDFKGLASNDYGWWYLEGGKVNFNYTGYADNSYGRWRIENGKVNFNYNDIVYESGQWRYYYGGLFQKSYTGVTDCGNASGWWYVKNGVVDFTANTVAANKNGWWKVTNGRVDFSFTGIAENSYGRWYIENGRVNFSLTGTKVINGRAYKIAGGKVS